MFVHFPRKAHFMNANTLRLGDI